jgi:opacity protein-like surface antigen
MNFAGAEGFENIFNPQNCLVSPWSAANPPMCFIRPIGPVSSWAKFGTGSAPAAAYGAFVGYNSQWDDAVLGVDINYNHTSLSGVSRSSKLFPGILPGDTTGPNNNLYDVWAGAGAIMKITDYATFRTKAGWAFDCFLPYATFGLAAGRAEITRIATASGQPAANSPGGAPFVLTDGDQKTAIVWGYSAGLGIDMALGANMFLRAEYEFVQFVPLSHITASLNTVRAGAGFRF